MRVAVVTDSTCDLPLELTEERGVRVVPLTVAIGAEPPTSRAMVRDEEFYARLASADELPTTSQPATPWFEEAWADARDQGVDAVVSLHVSAALSGTVDRARSLAGDAPLPVTVVDSRQVSGGLALQVLAAARAAADGADVPGVLDAAERVRTATTSVLAVDTLEYLRRGGRLSGARAAIGTALRVRPVLEVVDGRIEVVDRARTWSRAVARMVERVTAASGAGPLHVVVAHALDDERAATVSAALRAHVEVADELRVVIGPVVGTHTGPGAVGIAAVPRT